MLGCRAQSGVGECVSSPVFRKPRHLVEHTRTSSIREGHGCRSMDLRRAFLSQQLACGSPPLQQKRDRRQETESVFCNADWRIFAMKVQ
ncbi:hypothetical protein AVEN_465-1 [Araneus ventricosus]|uniref:Uncharacterized protein n=1 Tax=Araneus ventricosus TaxID=182803 RepID=A0A4Y2VQ30_ARAVE|nr:hypothetical protein AVEN_465-1 [Araneus ventricosus]